MRIGQGKEQEEKKLLDTDEPPRHQHHIYKQEYHSKAQRNIYCMPSRVKTTATNASAGM